jgi:hypothetical protein
LKVNIKEGTFDSRFLIFVSFFWLIHFGRLCTEKLELVLEGKSTGATGVGKPKNVLSNVHEIKSFPSFEKDALIS